jgi:hypothetical protein
LKLSAYVGRIGNLRPIAGSAFPALSTIQPNIETRSIPGIRGLQNIEIAVSVEIGKSPVMSSFMGIEHSSSRTAFAVAV